MPYIFSTRYPLFLRKTRFISEIIHETPKGIRLSTF